MRFGLDSLMKGHHGNCGNDVFEFPELTATDANVMYRGRLSLGTPTVEVTGQADVILRFLLSWWNILFSVGS